MKIKRLIAALLVFASMLTLPAMAASSFSDVHDDTTAINADVLRLMGVVNGSGNNNFSPDGTLSRAQFCAMAIRVMGLEDKVSSYTNRTIFSDVASRHWARGYINLAASTTVGGSTTRLITGVGDGRFLPDEAISYAQAVTILLRMLGYDDEDAGSLWPQGYMNLAESLGLNGQINAAAGQSINRSLAAQLFVNLLNTNTSGGREYYTTLGTVHEDVILFSVGGENSAVHTSAGTFIPAAGNVAPTALALYRGNLVLDPDGHIVTFLPERKITALEVTLARDAKEGELRVMNGSRYAVDAATPVYYGDRESTYAEVRNQLYQGMRLTLLLEDGEVVGLRWAVESGVQSPDEAQVVTGPVTAATFYQLTGGVSDYTILKDGLVISYGDIKPYDVATYDPITNTLTVSDLRLPCVYEKASPNPLSPDTITVLGHDFPVLESASESISQYQIGNAVTLLLTAQGQVAGMGPASLTSTAVGLAGSGSVSVYLPDGGSVLLNGEVPETAQDRLVTVAAGKKGEMTVNVLAKSNAPGDFNVNDMTLGTLAVTPNVRIFETVDDGAAIPLELSGLDMDAVPKNEVANYHQNTSGAVDFILLNNLTGDLYTYGILKVGTKEFFDSGFSGVNRTVSAINGTGSLTDIITSIKFTDGGFGGVVTGSRVLMGTPVAADVVELTAISGVQRTDFFMMDGVWYVNVMGAVYQVADHVEGYLKATESWFSQDLETIRAYSNNMTIHIDPIGQKVRIIVVD